MTKTNAIVILLIIASPFFLLVSILEPVEKPVMQSRPVWKAERYELTAQFSWVNATLNPLSKVNYTATGRIEIVSGAVGVGPGMLPRISLWIVDEAGKDELLSGSRHPSVGHGYGGALLPSKPDFQVVNPNYNGVYYFLFIFEDPGHIIVFGPPTISISLTESWTEKRSELNVLYLGLSVVLLFLGICLKRRRRKPPGLR